MRRKVIIGLISLIAIATLAVSSVDVSLATEEPEVLEHIGFKSLLLQITELEKTNGEVTAVLFNMSISIDNPNPVRVYGKISLWVKETETRTFLAKGVTVELSPNESSVISLEEVITDGNIVADLTKGNITLVVWWETETLAEDKSSYWNGAEGIEVYNEGSGVWSIPISVTPRPRLQRVEEIESPKHVSFKSIFVKITELDRIGSEVTAVLFNMTVIIDNPNPATVYMNYDFSVKEVETTTFLMENRVIIELPPNESSLISLEKVITDRNIVAHLTDEYQKIILRYYERWYCKEWAYPSGSAYTDRLEYIEVYNGSGVWPPSTSVLAKEPKIPEHVLIKKIEVNIEGEYPPHFFYMNVSIENPNPVMVKELIDFELKAAETTKFHTMRVIVELPPNESTVISLEEVITDINIWTNLPKENPIIYVSWRIRMLESGEGWTIIGDSARGMAEIVIYKGSGVWPTPSSVYVAGYVAKILKTLPERPETILAIAGLVMVTYMLLQPKRKKNLKIKTAARLGLLCIVLNLLGLGIFNPFYFIFIVAAILAYCCLLLKQKLSATVMMFIYSVIGAAIMVFFLFLSDVTSAWDYSDLAGFTANALYLLPAVGIVGFIISILLGVSIGIIADIIYAILKRNEAHAAVAIGLAIALVMSSIFIGGLSSGPGGLEGPFLAIVFLILFPMIACGAGGGFVGYLFLKNSRKSNMKMSVLSNFK